MSKRSEVPRGTSTSAPSYSDLAQYVKRTGKRKGFVARHELNIEPWQLSHLLDPEIYKPRVDEALLGRIAGLLNQPRTYVRKLYPRAA